MEYVWRRQWHPTPVLLPGKSHGWRSLEGCSPWGLKESVMTEWLTLSHISNRHTDVSLFQTILIHTDTHMLLTWLVSIQTSVGSKHCSKKNYRMEILRSKSVYIFNFHRHFHNTLWNSCIIAYSLTMRMPMFTSPQ